MRRAWFLTVLAILILLPLSFPEIPAAEAADVERVHVTNFPDTQKVRGEVRIPEPVPRTSLVRRSEIVGPVDRSEVIRLPDAGVLDATGFGSVVLSLTGFVKGPLAAPGTVGALLVPEVEEIERVRLEEGILLLPLTVAATVGPDGKGIFAAQTEPVALGFPRYRVFFFNESQRTVEASLYAYLGSG